MKNLLYIILSVIIISNYSCTSKGMDGCWTTDANTFARAIAIQKIGSLYEVDIIKSDYSEIDKKNLTLEGNRLSTGYGDFEYIADNDVLLDKSLEQPSVFKRITKEECAKLFQDYQAQRVKLFQNSPEGKAANEKAMQDSINAAMAQATADAMARQQNSKH